MSDELKTLTIDDTRYETRHTLKFERRKPYVVPDPRQLLSFIPGVVVDVIVTQGQRVKWGDTLLILEAMKMKNSVSAPSDGVVKRILVRQGDRVQKHQLLIEFE
ncbi:MAG: acetyl-CoA carboxylase biotin carboxyl carrier protein subunit [Bacteroidia bacterium]|nr:acetyl-CoA carboxylase biotin carboxyl carrier protein subunit [Bacteroidia bacterium]